MMNTVNITFFTISLLITIFDNEKDVAILLIRTIVDFIIGMSLIVISAAFCDDLIGLSIYLVVGIALVWRFTDQITWYKYVRK